MSSVKPRLITARAPDTAQSNDLVVDAADQCGGDDGFMEFDPEFHTQILASDVSWLKWFGGTWVNDQGAAQ
jgi:hypothetical protein